jgi:hypothetical protein
MCLVQDQLVAFVVDVCADNSLWQWLEGFNGLVKFLIEKVENFWDAVEGRWLKFCDIAQEVLLGCDETYTASCELHNCQHGSLEEVGVW